MTSNSTIQPRHAARWLCTLLVAVLMSGCVSNNVKRVNTVLAEHAERDIPQSQLVDVNIAQFDPGYVQPVPEKSNIIPGVRDAESGFIPYQLRDTLHNTGHWGPVRVVPEPPIASELLITGKILHSDGETLRLAIKAVDATGRVWLDRIYQETAAQLSYTDADPARLDPFQDLYNRVANDLLRVRRGMPAAALANNRDVAFLRFANDLAPDAFGDYLSQRNGRYSKRGMPSRSDPNIARIERIRERDYRVIDSLDQHFYVFDSQMQGPYDEWRAASWQEAQNLKEIRRQSATRMIAGAAAVAAGIYGAGKANSSAAANASAAAVIGGAYLFKTGFDKRSEVKLHQEALKELGESLAADSKPRVVELEGKTVTLKGSADAQYDEWRRMMRKIYAEETGFIPVPEDDYRDRDL